MAAVQKSYQNSAGPSPMTATMCKPEWVIPQADLHVLSAANWLEQCRSGESDRLVALPSALNELTTANSMVQRAVAELAGRRIAGAQIQTDLNSLKGRAANLQVSACAMGGDPESPIARAIIKNIDDLITFLSRL